MTRSRIGERLALGGAVHAASRHSPPLWRRLVEPLATVLVVAVVVALIGIGLNMVR